MSQADREQKLRRDIATLRSARDHALAGGRPQFAVDVRRLRELEADLAKIDARRAQKAAP